MLDFSEAWKWSDFVGAKVPAEGVSNCLGGEASLVRLLDRLDGKLTEHHEARERADTAQMKASGGIGVRVQFLTGWD